MMKVKLLCRLQGRDSPPFTVEVGLDDRVEKLRNVVAKTREVNAHPSDVTLYWVEYGARPAQVDMSDCKKLRHFNPDLSPQYKGLHVRVQINSSSKTPEANVGPLVGEDVGLKGLWKYSKLDLSLSQSFYLAGFTLSSHLAQRLPFRVRINDQLTAAKIFAEEGPEIRCDALSSLIDVLVMTYEAGLDEEDTKQSCQKLDDLLFAFTAQICRANGVQLKVERKNLDGDVIDEAKLRADLTVYCNGCVVLCGVERGGSEDDSGVNAELESKMRCWNPSHYGELPYILGFVAIGNKRQLSTFQFFGRERVQYLGRVSTTEAIKVFYNLAFVLSRMATLSKLTVPTPLSPFKPYRSETGMIQLVDDMIQLTTSPEHFQDGDDYKKLVEIYRTRMALTAPTLQSVRSLKQTRFRTRKAVVQLGPMGFHRRPENVDEANTWLKNMLEALKAWHESGYCHGAIKWENMAYVPPRRIDQCGYERLEPGYWLLVNLESSRRSSLITRGGPGVDTFHSCQYDLKLLGCLMKSLEFPLTHRLRWLQGKLVSARGDTEDVTAAKVLAMFNQTQNCRSEDLQRVASALLSALHTPEMTAESVLKMMKELVPPAEPKDAETSGGNKK